MTSVQRYLSTVNNLVPGAALTASSVKPSAVFERKATRRVGNGRISLAGSYTGHEATDVEVKISASGGTPRASAPLFSGVGNGKLTVLDVAPSAQLQTITLTLEDLGIQTQTAGLDVREVRIVAKQAGTVGNAISLRVTPQLTKTKLDAVPLADWPEGQPSMEGEQWDFGGKPLVQGQLDPASPRLRFGTSPTVYRQHREFKDGTWRFVLSPAPKEAIAKGSAVYSIAGGYDVDVTDGLTTESYAGVITLYDLLSALNASALVDVAGVVTADRAPGGQDAIDLPIRTTAWLQSASPELLDIEVGANAPTQSVQVTCVNSDKIGQERWEVVGDVSGRLPAAQTGQRYEGGNLAFTLTKAIAAISDGETSYTVAFKERGEKEGVPCVALKPIKLGLNAKPKSVTFRYKQRPPADCDCKNLPPLKLNSDCLGVATEGGSDVLDPEHGARLTALYEWRRDFVASNTAFAENTSGGFGYVRSDSREVEIANAITSEMAQALGEIYEVQAARDAWDIEFGGIMALLAPLEGMDTAEGVGLTATQWQPEVALSYGDYILPPARNGKLYRVAVPGSTGATPPDWNASPVIDGAVEYVSSTYWQPTASVSAGAIVQPGDGRKYIAETGGVTGGAEPFWAAGVQDGGVKWAMMGGVSREVHFPGDVTVTTVSVYPNAYALVYRRGGFAVNSIAGALHDNVLLGIDSARSIYTAPMMGIEAIQHLIGSKMDYCRTLAGIVPKSSASDGDAGRCWQDLGGSYWWVDTSGYYLPAFTNTPYISARRDNDGRPYSTQEFGFGLVVACPERLKEGDEFTVQILSVDTQKAYNVGDTLTLQTIGAGPAYLTGGVDGTDEHTWRVDSDALGALPGYIVPTNAPAPDYVQAGLTLTIANGGIPFALGDSFTLAAEAAQYQWRRDGGAWSVPADVPAPDTPAALPDGLQLLFEAGAVPSFVEDDSTLYHVHQPHAVSHLRSATKMVWQWAGSGASLVIDLGAVVPLDALALARYDLPLGAVVAYELSDDGGAWTAPKTLAMSKAVAVDMLSTSARFIRLTVASAEGGSIGWIWAGQALATEHHATRCARTRRWATSRMDAPNAAQMLKGMGDGWRVEWEDLLTEADAQNLLALADYAQSCDEPIIFVPHYKHPHDAALVRVTDDALEISDWHEYQPDDADKRLLSASLELAPVYK